MRNPITNIDSQTKGTAKRVRIIAKDVVTTLNNTPTSTEDKLL